MSQLEYLIPLVSTTVGLGLADLVQSLRELVRPHRPIRWHWLPLLWAGLLFLLVLRLWWVSCGILQEEVFGRALVFLPYLLMFLGLYLARAFALPDPACSALDRLATEQGGTGTADDAPSAPIDLEAFYLSASHRRWFFGTLIVIIVLFEVINATFFLQVMEGSVLEALARRANLGAIVSAALLGVLIATDQWWVHLVISVGATYGVVQTLAVAAAPIGR